MNIDELPHSSTLQNKMLWELYLHGLCKYSSTQQEYLYENSNKIVNCSYILVFLKSTCYTFTPDTHQWYRINANEITDNHKIALCNDPTVHMVPLPSAEPLEVNAVETMERLTHSHTSKNHPNDNFPQSIYSHVSSTNNSTNNSPQHNAIHPYDQSTVILQQFSMIIHELKNFTDKVSGDITENTQACTTAKEKNGKLIENVISKALIKPQDSIPITLL